MAALEGPHTPRRGSCWLGTWSVCGSLSYYESYCFPSKLREVSALQRGPRAPRALAPRLSLRRPQVCLLPLGSLHPPLLPRLLAHSCIPVRGPFLYVSEAKVWKMNLGLQRIDTFPPSACGMRRRSSEWASVSGSGWSRWCPMSSWEGICCQSPGQVHSGVVGAAGRRSPCSGRRSLASAVSPRSVCLLCNVTTRG